MGYLPDTTVHRLETAARVHLARQSRWLDTDTDPQDVIDDWLAELERARIETPTPENGDLLVKQHRGELWLLTAAGWRELAPLELQTDPEPSYRNVELHGEDVSKDRVHFEEGRGFLSGGACGVHGVFTGPVCPGCRRAAEARVILSQERIAAAEAVQRAGDAPPRMWGKGALETELDERAAREADRLVENLHGEPEQGVKAASPPWPTFVQTVLDDLAGRSVVVHQAAATLNEAEAVAEIDLLDSMRAFADGLDAARKRLLDAATEACWRP